MRRARNLLIGLVAWLAASGAALAASAGPAATIAGDVSQQILVMLRLPPEHFRPNSDYSGGYGDGQGRSARWRVASRLAHAHGLTLVSDWPMPLVGVDCFIMAAPRDRSPEEIAGQLSREPDVAWSEPVRLYHAQGAAAAYNDPLFPVQPAARQWRLADLHQVATGRNVKVAVIDSMVEAAHPDLAGQVQVSENFVADRPATSEQHGTGVAGIIAARANNGVGIVGVAPQARLMALRACWQLAAPPGQAPSTTCDSLSLARALQFAVTHNAAIINLSLSGPPDPLLGKLLDAAFARGATVVGAFDRELPFGGFPASHAGVVAVADETLAPAPSGVYIAPGRDVPTTQPGGRWSLVNGSSYAAAHVSGLLALVRQRAPRLLRASAPVSARPGGGAIDACATLVRAAGSCGCACARVAEHAAISRQ